MLDGLFGVAAGAASEFICSFARSIHPSSHSQSGVSHFCSNVDLGRNSNEASRLALWIRGNGERTNEPSFYSNIGDGGEVVIRNSDDVCNQSCRIAGWRDAGRDRDGERERCRAADGRLFSYPVEASTFGSKKQRRKEGEKSWRRRSEHDLGNGDDAKGHLAPSSSPPLSSFLSPVL